MHVLRSAVILALLAAGALAQTTNRWEKDIAAFEAQDRTNPPPKNAVLFIGSSSIRLWKTLAQDFPESKVINRGFGGSQIVDSVSFVDRIVVPYRPERIVMYAGGNDINAGKTPEQVASDFKEFVAKVHAKLPETRIAYISIAPNPARWAQVDRVKRANELIREFTTTDTRLQFIDVFPHMLGEDGKPLPEIFVEDRLHMNEKGYAIWKRVVGAALREN
jgi:lysophospholipase L1-like esterase